MSEPSVLSVSVRVPGTSANIGPGFDSFGVAVELFNEFSFEWTETPNARRDDPPGGVAGDAELPLRAFFQTMRVIESHLGRPVLGRGEVRVSSRAEVPIARGLGSSATCVVAGALAANEFARRLVGEALNLEQLAQIAANVEGHPDNVVPALLGGFRISYSGEGKLVQRPVPWPDDLCLCALIPDFTVPTKVAREILPGKVQLSEATFNVAHASLMVVALLTRDFELLREACDDRLHQPHRARLIPGYDGILEAANECGSIASYISGAGPTIMCIVRCEAAEEFAERLRPRIAKVPGNWGIKILAVSQSGATVLFRTFGD